MASVRCRDVPSPGMPGVHQPDARRVAAASAALRGGVPNAEGGLAPRWATAPRPPMYRLQTRPPADVGRAPLLYAGLGEHLRAARGARRRVRQGPEASSPGAARPRARVTDCTAAPRRGPGAFPDRPRPAARRPPPLAPGWDGAAPRPPPSRGGTDGG